MSHLAFDILRDRYRIELFPFMYPMICATEVGRYRYQHMDVIRHQMAFFDPALLPSCQIVKYLAQMPLDLPEQQLLAVLRRKHNVYLHCQAARLG